MPREWGGQGGSVWEAVEGIADVATQSLTAAFTLWSQRAFMECLLQSDNAPLRESLLPSLLQGTLAGAVGLSNGMKYLSGLEATAIRATPGQSDARWHLDGQVPWCTNVRPEGFVVAVAASWQSAGGGNDSLRVLALPGHRTGLQRSPDLDLIALRASNTAALQLDAVPVDASDVLHADARRFFPQARPGFLGLQCGLSIGLARSALQNAQQRMGGAGSKAPLAERLQLQLTALAASGTALREGLVAGRFLEQPQALFRIRLDLAECVAQAMQLELQASGGRAYQHDPASGFARRWREAAFIPIVTPSVAQLQGELQRQAIAAAARPAA